MNVVAPADAVELCDAVVDYVVVLLQLTSVRQPDRDAVAGCIILLGKFTLLACHAMECAIVKGKHLFCFLAPHIG